MSMTTMEEFSCFEFDGQAAVALEPKLDLRASAAFMLAAAAAAVAETSLLEGTDPELKLIVPKLR